MPTTSEFPHAWSERATSLMPNNEPMVRYDAKNSSKNYAKRKRNRGLISPGWVTSRESSVGSQRESLQSVATL